MVLLHLDGRSAPGECFLFADMPDIATDHFPVDILLRNLRHNFRSSSLLSIENAWLVSWGPLSICVRL